MWDPQRLTTLWPSMASYRVHRLMFHAYNFYYSINKNFSFRRQLFLFLSYSCSSLWSVVHPRNSSFHFSFLIFRQSVELLGRGISLSQGRYLHRTTQTRNKRGQTFMPRLAFEPTTPVFEWAKPVHALDRAATVIGFGGNKPM
jgi:hypothetical protein